jgi:hypothetical protein
MSHVANVCHTEKLSSIAVHDGRQSPITPPQSPITPPQSPGTPGHPAALEGSEPGPSAIQGVSLSETCDELERALAEPSPDLGEMQALYRRALVRVGIWQSFVALISREDPVWREVLRIEQDGELDVALERFLRLQRAAT